ncbi:Chemotaxis response regulator protein-glutamate methylesterase [Planctomycetes bacterium Poly30]|uniref:Protein-glutamate methylesterase/protein-glutamine glutaminase n=1 Tax=Saltatorellus ferox TaxID=2528018 RepID=A0A518F0S6_9BACT|nr:Chemotaxis response regulator protein-glutamate methylesterase [Planctomycetes bacterium Poly30]
MKPTIETGPPLRVMVVDDSPVTRRLIERVISREEGLELVAELADGKQAVEIAIRERVDVLILDLEMPEIDGREVLMRLYELGTQMGVVVYTGAAQEEVEELEKRVARRLICRMMPKGNGAGGGIEGLKDWLVSTIYDLGQRVRVRSRDGGGDGPAGEVARPVRPRSSATGSGSKAVTPVLGDLDRSPGKNGPTQSNGTNPSPPAALPRLSAGARPAAFQRDSRRFSILVVGASTGGPEALRQMIQDLPANFPIPVAIVQHMPIGFTAQLAARLDSQCAITVREATEGERLEAGVVLIAPGGKHLEVHRDGPHLTAKLTENEPENSCRPAVDVLFRSAAAAVPRNLLAVMLTGMGQDGLVGAECIRETGGLVIVQDEPTSVVWGMPGAIAKAGLANEVLPLSEVGPRTVEHVLAGRTNGRVA